MATNMTSIELSSADALLFVEFQKRYTFMQLLDSVGAFGIANGSVTVHFDGLGAIRTVDVQRHYKA